MFFRRQRRRTNSDLSPAGPSSGRSSIHSSTTSSRNPFSLPKALPKTSVDSTENEDDLKGPPGLTLLHSPSEPQVDFIFVHGLGGNSRKTWSKTSLNKSHFWPQDWLPEDPAFKNVRIHSFGYDADYLKGKEDCLNIHHIGKSLLGAISTSPCLIGSNTYIVAIGHSMGGLAIKKAYILAGQDSAHKLLARRFAAIYFLGTPHRGADSAKMLKNILKLAFDRAYVADLERNSGAIQVINDEFRHCSADLELWSFYETQKMKHFSALIVDPESAVLGYREEKQIPMSADHRSICKFETSLDANYILLRNALASTVSRITAAIPELKLKRKRDTIKDLRKYLEVSDILDDDLLSVCEARIPESCHWVSTKASYAAWRDGEPGNNRTLWIKGSPATGKSVLAGYVADQLRESGHACSYFFFKHGDKSKSSLGRCLRSLAFQMASSDVEAGDAILEMEADGIQLDRVDERTLWRILFLSGIFRPKMSRHYWVIDALDECSNSRFLLETILSRMDESVPLRIFITSRNTAELAQGFSGMPSNLLQSLSISTTDTESDLRLLVTMSTQSLEVVGPEDQTTLTEKILAKSKGSFLWTILVLGELMRCHSKSEIHQILEDIPRGMEPLYQRTLESMSRATRGKRLAKAILVWATCAARPMTISELGGALTLDIGDSFPRLKESIIALCGQLVVVDKFERVQMVHETAREFLLGHEPDSEFCIDKAEAHVRMAQVCLAYLTGEEMKPPRTNRRRSSATLATTSSGFALYACSEYSHHLSKAQPQPVETFQLVEQFFKSNVLTWIEAIANSRNLNQLIRASKHLKIYLNACAVQRSPLDPRIRTLRQWTTDLARIPAMFANALTASPSAIYSLIPPFCPTGSMIYNTTGPSRRLTVLGALSTQWDDRLLCLDFRLGQTSALCYGEEFLAIGLAVGDVALYYAKSFQQHKVLSHGEPVKFISFKSKTDLIATCGMKMVKIWNTKTGEAVCSLDSPPRPLAMGFSGEMLLVASHKNYVASWSLGRDLEHEPTRKSWDNGPETSTPPRQPPSALALSVNQGMLAVAYSSQPIMLWDMEEDAYVGSCGKKHSSGETSTHRVVALLFNPNPNIDMLAVAYLDGDLALLDPFADQQLECFRADCQTLAASPNGRLLAAGGANGIINVYEFDTLKLLYRVKSSKLYIKQLGFARDSLRLADIRGAQCTIWEPEGLLRDSLSDDSSGGTSTSLVETVSVDAKAKITAMVVHPTTKVIFCGKDDGSIVLYNGKTAERLRTLFSHKSAVRLLIWCRQKEALLSIDAANGIFLHAIQKSADQGRLGDATVLFKSRLESDNAIIDVLVGEHVGKFVVSTRESNHLFTLDSGEHEKGKTVPHGPDIYKWVSCPHSSLHMICINRAKACIYSWVDLSEVGSYVLSSDNDTTQLKSAMVYSLGQKQRIMLELSDGNDSTNTGSVSLFNADGFVPKNDGGSTLLEERPSPTESGPIIPGRGTKSIAISCSSLITTFAQDIAHVMGVNESGQLIFLNRSSWVCSANLIKREGETGQDQASSAIEVLRHFFVPYDWFAGKRDIVYALAQRDVLLTRGGDLAIIRGGYKY